MLKTLPGILIIACLFMNPIYQLNDNPNRPFFSVQQTGMIKRHILISDKCNLLVQRVKNLLSLVMKKTSEYILFLGLKFWLRCLKKAWPINKVVNVKAIAAGMWVASRTILFVGRCWSWSSISSGSWIVFKADICLLLHICQELSKWCNFYNFKRIH